MQNFWFKNYYVMLEKTGVETYRVVASSDHDTIRETFYFYPLSYIKRKIKKDIKFRLGIKEA